MATKEDILEQIVEEYLIHEGYFVQHNIKFLPRKDHPEFDSQKDSNHSDIDVIGYHPKRNGADKVLAVSCKSWQGGFKPAAEISDIANKAKKRGREPWKAFRELVMPKWSEGFMDAVESATGTRHFTHVTAVTKLIGDKSAWENHAPYKSALDGNQIRILTLTEMVVTIKSKLTTTLAATEVGRMIQIFAAAGIMPTGK